MAVRVHASGAACAVPCVGCTRGAGKLTTWALHWHGFIVGVLLETAVHIHLVGSRINLSWASQWVGVELDLTADGDCGRFMQAEGLEDATELRNACQLDAACA